MFSKVGALLADKGREVYSVAPSDSVARAAEEMSRHNVGAAVVLEQDRLAGIVTERDLLRKVVAGKRDAASTTVSDVMTRDVVALGLDDDLEEALALVHARHIRHLPVVADGQVVGLVTSGDLTRWAVRDRTVQLDILMESGQREFPL